MVADVKECPLCRKEFGIFRFRYKCAACLGTFCDDCTPNKYVIPPNSSAESVCTTCERNLGSSVKTKDGGRRLGSTTTSTSGNVDNDREERARLAEQRAEGKRNVPKVAATSQRDRPKEHEAPPAPASEGRALGGGADDSSSQPMNPVLAAALKREQQGRRQESGPKMDPERQKVLREIQAVLRQRDEDEPFGLRAMDVVKMRMYLRDLTSRGK